MTGLRPVLLASGALLLLVGGCRAPKPKGGAISAESHAPGTTQATIPASCASYPPGATGVVRTFCNGPAAVKLTVDGTDHLLKGGTCSAPSGAPFTLNLGIVAGPGLAGPRPDYVGVTVASPPGPFADAVISIHLGGKVYDLRHNQGQFGPAGGQFSGLARKGRSKVSGSFTC